MTTKFLRFFKEKSWFAGLLDETRFKGVTTPESTDFQNIETKVYDTSSIDTYDLVFNLQMPSIANTKFFKHARNSDTVDYYCNNKIHIRLYFKDENIFDNLVGTECVISPQIFQAQTSRESDGIYFGSLNQLREKISDATTTAIIEGSKFEYDDKGIKTKVEKVKDKNGKNVLDDRGNPVTVKVPIPKSPSIQRMGPFAESETVFTHENIVKKLKSTKYLDKYIDYIGKEIKPGEEGSPFQVYKTRYSTDVPDYTKSGSDESANKPETPGLVSNTNFMSIEEKKRYFDGNYQYYMQFDFDLNEYKLDKDESTGEIIVVKKTHPNRRPGSGSTATIDTNDSLIMLLKKNQWFSVVFKNINIPFDIKQIPGDVIKLEFQIDNISPPDSIGEANIFYKNFFCEYLNMTLKNYIKTPIQVHDVMFQYNDMITAVNQKSDKYFSKIAQLNYIARKVIYYYLKNLDEVDEKYTSTYKTMTALTSIAANKTSTLIAGTSKVTTVNMSELTEAVKNANNKIKIFSDIFRRDNIKVFKRHFLNAIMRIHQKSGLSSVTDEQLVDEYAKIKEFIRIAKMGKKNPRQPPSVLVTNTDPKGNPTGVTGIVPDKVGANDRDPQDPQIASPQTVISQAAGNDGEGETRIVQYQTGGGGGFFESEDYNLMIPMDIYSPGNGINDMTVRIHKIHLQEGGEETREMDDKSSVDISVGDAIRFVYGNDIVYAIVCGFKPGKPLNKDGSDKAMEMNDFYNTYKDIRNTFESQNLNLTPEEFLSLTNMRGIKFLPFKYVNETYSFTPYDTNVSESLNSKLKTGLNGKFVFSCKDDKIPILPNGYVLPFVSRVKENISTTFNKIIPFSTKADIGKDNKLPQYSLPSYMTLEKVFVPPNFSEVIKKIKEFREDNPDDILKDLIKIMEKNGLNDSNDCKKTSEKIAASNTENRKKDFQTELKRINSDFKNKFLPKGQLINRKGAMQYIQRLYKQKVKEGVFVDNEGQPIRTATKLVFALNLIPNDPKKSMDLLIRALSQDGVSNILERKKELSKEIISQEQAKIGELGDDDLFEKYGGGGDIEVQYGGAEDTAKAEQIIKDTVNLLNNQNMITIYGKTKDTFISDLESAETSYDPDEKEPTVETSTSMVKSGVGPGTGFGSGSGTGTASGFLSNLFNKGSMGSSSSSGMGSGSDSCGNNTSIMCSGDDLVITVTLKLNELIASCMDHKSIQNYGSQPGNFQKITNGEGEEKAAPAAPVVQPDAPPQLNNPDAPPQLKPDVPANPAAPAAKTDVPAAKPDVPANPAADAAKAVKAADKDEVKAPPESGSGKPVVIGTKAADAAGTESDVPPETATLIAETSKLYEKVKPIVEERKNYKNSANNIIEEILSEINDNTIGEIIKDLNKNIKDINDDASGHKIIVDNITSKYENFLKSEKFTSNVDKIHNMGNDIKKSIENTNKEIIAKFTSSLEKLNESQKILYSKAKKLLIPVIPLTIDEMKQFFIATVIDRIEKKVGTEPEGTKSKLYKLLVQEANPSTEIIKGGVNNNSNNKTKNNRKSNKNKTKKRKGKKSNSRKVKFAKVKKV